jgi:tRNA 2-thiocytidine biosynthesis protein TtcA
LGTSDSDRLAVYLLKEVTRAIGEFDLIADGDRVAVAVSGGKDSRALLELLLHHRRKVPYRYELTALHVVGTPAGFPDLRPELEPWFRKLGVEYHFTMEQAQGTIHHGSQAGLQPAGARP